MSESDIDREIAESLNVDPSPEFLARVRLRIAEDPAPSRWSLRWLAWSIATAVPSTAIVVVAIVLLRSGASPLPSPGASTVASADVRLTPEAGPVVDKSSAAIIERHSPTAPRVLAVRARPQRHPEVLVSAVEIATVRQLVANASRSGVVGESVAQLTAATLPLDPIEKMAVPSLVIEPIAPLAQ